MELFAYFVNAAVRVVVLVAVVACQRFRYLEWLRQLRAIREILIIKFHVHYVDAAQANIMTGSTKKNSKNKRQADCKSQQKYF